MTGADREASRIRAEYERRKREIARDVYALTNPPNLFFRQGQQRALLEALRASNQLPLADRKILEIGCGGGTWLRMLHEFGARAENLAGIDLDESRAAAARTHLPSADIRVGDAARLPWPDGAFDIVLQATVFTSILDNDVRAQVAAEMGRVASPGGIVLWYDFRYNNPSNPNVRGVGARALQSLFPGRRIQRQSVTLAPPIARRLVPRAWPLAALLERLQVLNTHYLAVIQM